MFYTKPAMRLNAHLFPVMPPYVRLNSSVASNRGTDDPIVTLNYTFARYPSNMLHVTRSTGAGGQFRFINPYLYIDTSIRVDDSVGSGTTYRYAAISTWVKRFTAQSPNPVLISNIRSLTTASGLKPTSPTGSADGLNLRIALAINAGAIVVSFIDNSTIETGFALERSTDGGMTWPVVYTLGPRTSTGLVTYTDTAVVSGVVYTYRAKATKSTSLHDSAYCRENSISF